MPGLEDHSSPQMALPAAELGFYVARPLPRSPCKESPEDSPGSGVRPGREAKGP